MNTMLHARLANSPAREGRRGAFTLLELLIVIAILMILAALGAVNFQMAQARGKVARALSDMRTISSALEAYRTDQAGYPPAAIGDIQVADPLGRLTRPVAYISTIPTDSFGAAAFDFNPGIVMLGYNYKDRATTSIGMPAETYGEMWQSVPDKQYMLHSCGPNRIWDVTPFVDYDATNGAVSRGDIIRFGP